MIGNSVPVQMTDRRRRNNPAKRTTLLGLSILLALPPLDAAETWTAARHALSIVIFEKPERKNAVQSNGSPVGPLAVREEARLSPTVSGVIFFKSRPSGTGTGV
jgi:hypothetical protein